MPMLMTQEGNEESLEICVHKLYIIIMQQQLFNSLQYFKMQITSKEVKKVPLQISQPQKPKSLWEMLIGGIVRPPRAYYRENQLGTKHFIYNEVSYNRKDVQVNHQNKNILLTIFQPQNMNKWVILYLHGNSSSKLQSVSLLKYMPRNFNLASFDFIGCGQNKQADTVSLGIRESQQVSSVVQYLRSQQYRVILWGRSMGAASALRYGKAEIIIADSSFKCFKSLCKQVAKSSSPFYVPNCLINCFFPCVFYKLKNEVKQKGEYNVEQLDIRQSVKQINPNTLIIFMSGDKDSLIHHRNSKKLYDAFPGKNKYLQIFDGTHNTKRPEAIMKKVMGMIESYVIQLKQFSPKSATRGFIEIP